MSDNQWKVFDDGDREFTGDYDVWIGTEREDGTGSIVGACFRDHARLIAAAPDMLAALQWIETYARVQVERHPEAEDTPGWSRILAAIAKATGA